MLKINTYPVTLHAGHFRPLLIGGGRVAVRKLKGLLAAGMRPTIISLDFSPEMQALILQHHLPALLQPFSEHMVQGFNLIIAATSDKDVNNRISRFCIAQNLPVNNVSSPGNGSFSLPAVVDRNELKIAVSTGAGLPLLSAEIRKHLDGLIHPEASQLCAQLLAARNEMLQMQLTDNEKQTVVDQQLKPMVEELVRTLFLH